jgi:hypothetical protein
MILKKKFLELLVYDYTYFIKSFFNYYEKGIYYIRIKDDLISYFTSGNPNFFNLSNTNTEKKLANLYKSNKNRLLQGDNTFSGGAPKKKLAGLSVITKNDSSVSSNTNLGLSAKTHGNNSNTNLGLSASFLSLQNTPPRPTQNLFNQENLNLENQYSKSVFQINGFKNISTSGKQSNMMVSSDNQLYFTPLHI